MHQTGSVARLWRYITKPLGVSVRAFFIATALLALPAGSYAGERVLHIFSWADYFDSTVVDRFQKKYDCTVIIDIFDSNEILYKALQVDRGSYDVLTPSSYMTAMLYRDGYLARLDHSLLPNLKHLTPDAAALGDDPTMFFSIPYARTVTGVGYNKKRIPASVIGSWDIFDRAPAQAKIAFLTDMRECLGAALKSLGCSLNSTDAEEIAAAGRVVARWKRRIDLFDAERGKEGLMDGKYALALHYNGDMFQAMAENPDLDFFIPREGSAITTDEFVVAVDSPLQDLAHAFINHMLDPEMARQNMESIRYYMPNAAALRDLPPELLDSPAFSVSQEVLEKCETILDVGEANRVYERAWEEAMR